MGKSLDIVCKRLIFVPGFIISNRNDAQSERKKSQVTSSLSKEEELQAELLRLRKALEYSELRNEALSEVLKIGREEYGIDLLKKAGAKQ